ncbi:Fe-S cluster assembly protein SufD [Candidatus Pelagibacter bacterium nBUS_32]|uniref:Fe-S cluster assembly protein SufD n=1 Tax=Candidatus Pelagibacter bacterium nBUS_32 TaxID=3374192 RepID=UPI003EBFC9A5
MQNEIKSNFEKSLSEGNYSTSQKEIKEKNFNKFIDQGFPNKRFEDWKFSDLNQIISANFKKLDFYKENNVSNIDFDSISDFNHNKIVFVNGSVSKIDFSYENEEKIIINQNLELDNELSENVLLNLNTAFLSSYIKITVSKGYQFQKPLILYNYLTSDLDSCGLNMKLDINLEDDTSMDVVNISNENAKNNFLNFRQKINIGKNSILKNYSLDVKPTSNIKYSFKDIDLDKNSHLEYFILSKGSKFAKHDINCSLNNNHGSVAINGIIDLDNKKHHEIKTAINHNEENCKSYQLIKSVLNENSKGVYQGKIYVNSKAQKTDGYQLSRALLLNDDVEFNAKPELEIYADDVKCSHGSTSGNIDENSIFYLMSRGLSHAQSKKLLTNGFLNEAVEKITNQSVKSLVKKLTGIQE